MATKSTNKTHHFVISAVRQLFDTVEGRNYNEYELKDGHGKLYRYGDFAHELSDFTAGTHIELVTTAAGDYVSVRKKADSTNCRGCLTAV